jgi:tetratricopeptide (TPR) repeat protein
MGNRLEHLNAALDGYQRALELIPPADAENLAVIHHQLGLIYQEAGYTRQALHHFQQAIDQEETRGNIYGAGQTRLAIAGLLGEAGRLQDALLYARAALHDFQRTGPGAADAVTDAQDVIAALEEHLTKTT